MDALDKKVFSEQLNQGVPFSQAKSNIASLAQAKFQRDYRAPLEKVAYPPKSTVKLRGKLFFNDTGDLLRWYHSDMHKSETECDKLIVETARALDSKALELLLLSAQRNAVEFSINYVIQE